MTDRKTFEWAVKFGSVQQHQGIVTAVVSVFGNRDAQNDVVLPGAFTNSIAKWKAKMAQGSYLPVVYAHRDDPAAIIGKVVGMRETDVGLEVTEQFFLDKPMARDTFAAILEGVLPKSSFAYDVVRAKSNGHGGLDLAELGLIEVGSTLYAANTETHLVGIKAAALDDSPWDGNKAMTACSSAADYRQICAGEHTTGSPDERQHWALPHHYLGKPANAAGVAAARARFDQTQDLTNRAAARTHLFETHRLPSDSKAAAPPDKVEPVTPSVMEAFSTSLAESFAKAGREISAKNQALIMQMHDVAHQLLGMPVHDSTTTENETGTGADKADEPQVKAELFPRRAAIEAVLATE